MTAEWPQSEYQQSGQIGDWHMHCTPVFATLCLGLLCGPEVVWNLKLRVEPVSSGASQMAGAELAQLFFPWSH